MMGSQQLFLLSVACAFVEKDAHNIYTAATSATGQSAARELSVSGHGGARILIRFTDDHACKSD